MVTFINMSAGNNSAANGQQTNFTTATDLLKALKKNSAYLSKISTIAVDMNEAGASALLAHLAEKKTSFPVIKVVLPKDITIEPQTIIAIAQTSEVTNNITTIDALSVALYAYSNNDIDLLDKIGIRPPTDQEHEQCHTLAELLERRITTGITMQEFQYRAKLSPHGTKVPKEIKLIKGDKEITTDQKDIPTLDSTQLIITAGKGADMVTTDNRTRLPYTIKQLHESDIDAARRYARETMGYKKNNKLEYIKTLEIKNQQCDYHIATADIPNTHIKAGMLYRDKPRTVVLKDKKFKRHAIERHFEVTSANKAKHSFESPALKDVARQLAKIMRVTRIAKRSSQQFMVNRLENASISVANKKHAISGLLPSRQTVRGWGQHALNQLPTREGTYNYWTTGAIPDLIHYVRHEGRPIERTINSGYYLRTGQVTYPTIHHDGPIELTDEQFETLKERLQNVINNGLNPDEEDVTQDNLITKQTIDQWINDTLTALALEPYQQKSFLALIRVILRDNTHDHYLGNYGDWQGRDDLEEHANLQPILHRLERRKGLAQLRYIGNSFAYFFNSDNPQQHYVLNDYDYNYEHNSQREGSRKYTFSGLGNSIAWKLSRTTTSHARWGKLYNREKPFWTGYKPFNLDAEITIYLENHHHDNHEQVTRQLINWQRQSGLPIQEVSALVVAALLNEQRHPPVADEQQIREHIADITSIITQIQTLQLNADGADLVIWENTIFDNTHLELGENNQGFQQLLAIVSQLPATLPNRTMVRNHLQQRILEVNQPLEAEALQLAQRRGQALIQLLNDNEIEHQLDEGFIVRPHDHIALTVGLGIIEEAGEINAYRLPEDNQGELIEQIKRYFNLPLIPNPRETNDHQIEEIVDHRETEIR